MGVLVDALVYSAADSSFLQQACFLTGGCYLRPTDQKKESLPLLLMYCLPNKNARKILRGTTIDYVDFRTACTCHGNQVQFAFMCSVCLGVTCTDPSHLKHCEVIKVCISLLCSISY